MSDLTRDPAQANTKSWPQNSIQKISQEGSKNTYVIILSKDSIRPTKGPPVIKQSPVESEVKGNLNFAETVQEKENRVKLVDEAFDSPTIGLAQCRISPKANKSTEDVRLNLSNIQDDEYDSNVSASNVFLTGDTFEEDQDSAIHSDIFHRSSENVETSVRGHNSRSLICNKPYVNSYFIQSPLAAPYQKSNSEHRAFPMISPQCVGNRQSKLAYHTPDSFDDSNHPTARQIFVVNQTPATQPNANGSSVIKKTVSYTNTAVPVLGKSFHSTPVSQFMSKTNPKAVPTLSNISPISQKVNNNYEKCAQSNAAGSILIKNGPLTSTPIFSEASHKLQQVNQDSSTHRPVYVIPSPFVKQKNDIVTSQHNNSVLRHNHQSSSDSSLITVPSLGTSSLNNSSGFVSGSFSSWDLQDGSNSFDGDKGAPAAFSRAGSGTGVSSDEVVQSLHAKGGYSVSFPGGELDSQAPDDDSVLEFDLGFGGYSEMEPFVTSSQESVGSDFSDKAGLNQSLTNMQWLKGMQMKEEKSVSLHELQQQQRIVQWKTLSANEIKAISAECGLHTRPPFSYMVLIQMALRSRQDCKMMLKEICKWIEETFPYYRYTAKPGWKSSIRHNLSLYNIFEREPAKRHGSYWTIRSDREPRAKQYQRDKCHNNAASSPVPTHPPDTVIPIIPMYSSMGQLSAISPQPYHFPQNSQLSGKKKAPPRILPRPSPNAAPQTFALIPISNGVNQPFNLSSPLQQQQPMFMSVANNDPHSACPSPGLSEMSAAVASIQMSASSPVPSEPACESPIIFQQEHIYNKRPMSLSKQTWLEVQSSGSMSSFDSELTHSTDIASSNELIHSNDFKKSKTKSKTKRPRDKPSLPRPTLYKNEDDKSRPSGSKRRKLLQKERPLANDSSDEDDDGTKFISNLEKDILAKPAFMDNQENLTTSTPVKSSAQSNSQLPSPIRGLTPLRNSSLFDGSFLETLGDRKALGLSPDTSVSVNKQTRGAGDSLNSSLLDFNVLPFASPDKMQGSPDGNQNLSRFLSEYVLDQCAVDSDHWNWSVVQQLVDDNLDTS